MVPSLHYQHANVDLALLRRRAYNYRWATLPSDVIALTAADPDFPVADPIREAVTEYARSGLYCYGPHEGLPEFREEAARMLRDRRGIDADASRVLPLDSAASAMAVAARFCLESGDEAIIFDPVDYLFRTSVEAAGGKVRLLPLDPQTGRPDFQRLAGLVTPRTRLIGVCNPLNPLGLVLREDELRVIGEVAVERRLWILSDEIWSDIVFSPHRYTSVAALGGEMAGRTLTVYGLSKTYGLAGLRVGFLLAPSDEVYRRLVDESGVLTTAGGVSTIAQVAAVAAYQSAGPWVEAFLSHLLGQRDYAVERLSAIPGVRCTAPEGTYLLFPEVEVPGLDSTELAAELLHRARLAVVPGSAKFFGPAAEGHLRLCFATSREILAEGLDRFEGGLASIRAGAGA